MKNENEIKDIFTCILNNNVFMTARNLFIEFYTICKKNNINIDYDDSINYLLKNIVDNGDISFFKFSYGDYDVTDSYCINNYCFYLSKNKITDVYQNYKELDTGIYP